jgi:hypothetical protein
MEVIGIIAIVAVGVAAIVAGLIIYFTKGPPKTLVLLQTPPEKNPLLYGVNRSTTKGTWVDPYSLPVVTPPNRSKEETDIYMKNETGIYKLSSILRKNARKHRASRRR